MRLTHFALPAGRFCGTSTKNPGVLAQFSSPPPQTWPDNARFTSRLRSGNGNRVGLSRIDGGPRKRKAKSTGPCLLCMRGNAYLPRVSPRAREKGTKRAAKVGRRCFLLKRMLQQSNSCRCQSQHALSRRPPTFCLLSCTHDYL